MPTVRDLFQEIINHDSAASPQWYSTAYNKTYRISAESSRHAISERFLLSRR